MRSSGLQRWGPREQPPIGPVTAGGNRPSRRACRLRFETDQIQLSQTLLRAFWRNVDAPRCGGSFCGTVVALHRRRSSPAATSGRSRPSQPAGKRPGNWTKKAAAITGADPTASSQVLAAETRDHHARTRPPKQAQIQLLPLVMRTAISGSIRSGATKASNLVPWPEPEVLKAYQG